jgi:hypothetical protein
MGSSSYYDLVMAMKKKGYTIGSLWLSSSHLDAVLLFPVSPPRLCDAAGQSTLRPDFLNIGETQITDELGWYVLSGQDQGHPDSQRVPVPALNSQSKATDIDIFALSDIGNL